MDASDDVVERLLDETEHATTDAHAENALPSVSVLGAFKARELRKPLVIVAWIMFAQQVSGTAPLYAFTNCMLTFVKALTPVRVL